MALDAGEVAFGLFDEMFGFGGIFQCFEHGADLKRILVSAPEKAKKKVLE
jgi:hypothetical protein